MLFGGLLDLGEQDLELKFGSFELADFYGFLLQKLVVEGIVDGSGACGVHWEVIEEQTVL